MWILLWTGPRAALACDPSLLASLGLDESKQRVLDCTELAKVDHTVFLDLRIRDLAPRPWQRTDVSRALARIAEGKPPKVDELGAEGPLDTIEIRLLDTPQPLLWVEGRTLSDGESSYHTLSLLQLSDIGPLAVFRERMVTDSGSGYPSSHGDFGLELVPSEIGSGPNLHFTKREEVCPDPDADCTTTNSEHWLCFSPPASWQEAARCPRKPSARATSTLPPGKKVRYDAALAIDGDPATAWVEGEPGPGLGARLHIDLGPLDLREIALLPGYGKSDELWTRNNRLRTARIHLSDGASVEASFEDERTVQSVSLGEHTGIEWVEIEILSVYPGSRDDDTCISEVTLP